MLAPELEGGVPSGLTMERRVLRFAGGTPRLSDVLVAVVIGAVMWPKRLSPSDVVDRSYPSSYEASGAVGSRAQGDGDEEADY